MAEKPNFVFFLADQMRADALGHLGSKASITPNMDSLIGNGGVSYRNAYCQNPVCVPSRCSFLTGWYPHTRGHRTMHYLLDKDDPMLLKTLKKQGYKVVWLGRNDVIPADRDFSEYCDVFDSGFTGTFKMGPDVKEGEKKKPSAGLYSFFQGKAKNTDADHINMVDWNCVNKAIRFFQSRTEDEKQPFCLYISLTYPHPPYVCEDPWFSEIDRSKIKPIRPEPADWSSKASMLEEIHRKQNLQALAKDGFVELRATYLAMVARFDYQLGMVIKSLRDAGLYDDTALFVFSDHGDYTGDYGVVEKSQNTFEDCLVNVPLIIKPQKNVPSMSRISQALVELDDIPATVAELADFDLGYTQFGKSLVHTLAGDENHKDAVFCEGGRIHGETQAMELGHGKDSPYWPRLSTQSSEGPEHTKAVMIRTGKYKYVERLYEHAELYDLDQDPDELCNLSEKPEYQGIVSKMQKRLLKFYMETTDFVPDRKDRRF